VEGRASPHPRRLTSVRPGSGRLVALLLAQLCAYIGLNACSARFPYESATDQRPIAFVIGVLVGIFVLHLLSLRLALRLPSNRQLQALIFIGAVGFRSALLTSHPIQEVDIYRYLWDGAVAAEGINPYRYSPLQVRTTSEDGIATPELLRLRDLGSRSPAIATVLTRVHFGQFTTVYPPVSQAVFAAAALVTPPDASLSTRLTILKGILVAFDLLTLGLVMQLLHLARRHQAWSILYGWCPLVLKEFANSGHLDAIAVCLTAGAALLFLCDHGCVERKQGLSRSMLLSSMTLALATGAKLYPAVLIPLLCLLSARRYGLRSGVVYAGVFGLTLAVVMSPMLGTQPADLSTNTAGEHQTLSSGPSATDASLRPESGLTVFLRQWEMNDLIFMLIVENLRPPAAQDSTSGPDYEPWFVVAPSWIRTELSNRLSTSSGLPIRQVTFAATRFITLAVFVVIAALLARRAAVDPDAISILRCAFLTIAWFWALSPTQNPWYWTWALPFLPFARSRSWVLISGLLLLYYSRFVLLYDFKDVSVLFTAYKGEDFFHYVVVPVEHGCWMLCLGLETFGRRGSVRSLPESE